MDQTIICANQLFIKSVEDLVVLNPRLIDVLCCPAESDNNPCHGQLSEESEGLRCHRCGQLYSITNNIPVMVQSKIINE